MVCKISFLLPSNRSSEIISKVVDNINSLQLSKSYEIVICSPEKIVGDNVIWVEDLEQSGCVNGFNRAYKKSIGEYIILSTDDHFFDKNVEYTIDELENSDKKYKILSITGEDGTPCNIPNDLPKYEIVRFPVYHKETIEKYLNGYVYNPEFNHHYPDNWLGFWLGEMGQPSKEISYTKLHQIEHRCRSDFDQKDRNTFYRLVQNFRDGDKSYV